MGKLSGCRALVTGSSSGLGAGTALAFAREGASVVVNYPNAEHRQRADDVVDQVRAAGVGGVAIQADVGDAAQVERLVSRTMSELGGLDILVNNAGIAETVDVQDMSIDAWDRMVAVHLRSVFLATRLALPIMYGQNNGKIINTASQLAYKGAAGSAHYAAAKAGIIGFTRSLALEVGTRNVNVNCVAPGAINTPLLKSFDTEVLNTIKSGIPMGRFADVSEIVPAYVFLASADGRFFQGQCISPNGGDVFL